MKLISEIINELVDSEKSISSPLLKTKVLASRLNNTDLLNWVTNELRGYESEKTVPKYRRFKGSIIGTYRNGDLQYNEQPVPLLGLKKPLEESLRSMIFTQSISNLETMKSENESGLLVHVFPAELTGLIQENWRKMGNPYLQIINCKKSISISAVSEILSIVRNNLLDFTLKIDAEFGHITEIEELKSKRQQISTIMNQTIINTSGDGNIVNTGDKAKISAKIHIKKGNKDDLVNHLQRNGVKEEDTSELIELIDSEAPNLEQGTFGNKVNLWTQKMIGKALDGSWNIGIGAAGTLLAEAIKLYYGM